MPRNPAILAQNLGVRTLKTASVRLSDEGSAATLDYAEIISGTGAPSGGYGRDASASLMYIRRDASSAANVVYVSHNGGTAWTAEVPDTDTAVHVSTSNTTGATAAADGNTGDNGNSNTSAELTSISAAAAADTGSNTTGISGATALFDAVAPANYNGSIPAKTVAGTHAGFAGNDGSNNFPGPFNSIGIPRNARVVFGAGWDGGDVVIGGNTTAGIFDYETFADPGAGGGTVVGVKCFVDVQGATKSAVGIDPATASIGTGDKIGAPGITAAVGFLAVDGVAESVTFDATACGYTPTSTPDGAKVFAAYHPKLMFAGLNFSDPGHTHTSSAINVTDGGHAHIVAGHTHTSSAVTVTDPGHTH